VLGPRLRAVAALVPPACSVVDVGAGDGQLASALAAAGHRVIATEAQPGPLLRLRARAGQAGIECRLGDGLRAVRPGEVEVAVLAGMGGLRMIRILDASAAVVAELKAVLLQPMQHLEELRLWVDAAGLELRSEVAAAQGRRRYTVLLVGGGASGAG
jgi:tRNA (adenine22-N1)-methyltransferase